MSRRRKDPLRPLLDDERVELGRLSRSTTAHAVHVARAVMLLAVADGSDYQSAARAAGRRSGDAVSHLIARFNAEGLDALEPRHGGGRVPTYTDADRERILREASRTPTPEADGTATWSLALLRRVLRAAPDGLPAVSTFTIWRALHEAGYTFQKARTWCPTGRAGRRLGTLAGRAELAHHAAGGAAPAADAPRARQLGLPQDAHVRAVALRARDHAPLHPALWIVAQYDREHPAGLEAAGARRPAPGEPGRDHRPA